MDGPHCGHAHCAPLLRYKIRYQKGRGMQTQVAPKIGQPLEKTLLRHGGLVILPVEYLFLVLATFA